MIRPPNSSDCIQFRIFMQNIRYHMVMVIINIPSCSVYCSDTIEGRIFSTEFLIVIKCILIYWYKYLTYVLVLLNGDER